MLKISARSVLRALACLCAAALAAGSLSCERDAPAGETESPVQSDAPEVMPGEEAAPSDTARMSFPETEAPPDFVMPSGLVLYVDGSAREGGSGGESDPFRTLREADEAIAALNRGGGLPEGGVAVIVRPGVYYLPEGFSLSGDGARGTEACPIAYVSEEPRGALITGAASVSLTDGEPLNEAERARIRNPGDADRIVKIDLTRYGKDAADWGEMYAYGAYGYGWRFGGGSGKAPADFYLNGRRLTPARYPNDDFTEVGKVVSAGSATNTAEEDPEGPTFAVRSDVQERIRGWAGTEDVWAFGYFMYDWADAANPVKSVSESGGEITLGHPVFYGIAENQRYYLFNVFEELDAEGEYYLDRSSGMLYVYLPDGPDGAELTMADSGAPLLSGNASCLTVKGFRFAGSGASAGIQLGGDHIRVEDCEVSGIRGVGMRLDGTDITVLGCEITAVGESGLRVSGGNNALLERSGNLIYNNYVHGWSEIVRTCQDGINVSGCGNTVAHNRVSDAPHQAIGWNGAYTVIEYNEVSNVCYETSDCGALYAGRNFVSYGSVVRCNYIHDIGESGNLCVGIYLDDGMSGQTVCGNLIVNTARYGILVGGGRDNTILNNVIVNAHRDAIYHDARLREGEFEGGWYGTMASRGTQFTEILGICRGEMWRNAFPILSELIIQSAGEDKDNPLLACNPAGSIIRNNVYYRSTGGSADTCFFDPSVADFSEAEDNIEGDWSADLPGGKSGDYHMPADAPVFDRLPEFGALPVDDMGQRG